MLAPLAHRRRTSLLAAVAAAVLAAALLALAVGGAAKAAAATCPSFKVLHDDRIGAASLPAGNYSLTTDDAGLACTPAAQLFARFLEDYDGNLPAPWRITPEGSGKASFSGGSQGGFSVARTGGGEESGGNSLIGELCSGTFTVNISSRVGPLLFPKGKYLLYRPVRATISCNRAAVLFSDFLVEPGGQLPFPWKLRNQTATFYKSSNPARSAFRIEPIAGA